MSITIVLRAQDSSSCALFLRGLGIGLERPNPMHPDAWLGHLNLAIEIAPGEPGPTTLSLASTDALGLARGLAERGGSIDFSQVRSDPPVVLVTGPNGERLAIEEREERPSRPALDESMICHVRVWLKPHVQELRRLVEASGAARPRILGPVALGRRAGEHFTLILDTTPDADLGAIDEFLAAVGTGPIGLRASSASTLPEGDRARLDAIAFPL